MEGREAVVTDQAGSGSLATSNPAVPRAAAVDALRRVLSSEAFAGSPRSRDFLAYVVRETLDGRGSRLKERTIARGALDRSADFDARHDARVRVQATRVRALLERYYAGAGAEDAVRILVPKGSYVPAVTPAPEPPPGTDEHALATLGPGVAIVQFTRPDGLAATSALAIAVTESLVNALSSFPGIRVVGPVDEDEPAASRSEHRRLASRFGVQYVLRGALVELDRRVRVTVRLTDASSGDVVWAETLDRDGDALAGFPGQDEVVRHVAGVVGDFSGAVLRHASRSSSESSNPVVWAAMLEFYDGLEASSRESALPLRATLLAAHELEPQNAVVLGMLAATESFLAMYSHDGERAALADACEVHARAALVINPMSGHAHLTLGTAALARGLVPLCLEHLRLAADLSPSNPSILYGAGWMFGLAGEWNKGVGLVRESVRLNPASPALRYLFLAVDGLMAGDFSRALADVMRYPHTDDFWQPLVLSLALDGLGHADAAEVELAKAQALVPDLREAVREAWVFPPVFQAFVASRIDELLDSAGSG
jgi:TolB-like protein